LCLGLGPFTAKVRDGHHGGRPLAGPGLDPQGIALAERRAQTRVDVREADSAARTVEHHRDPLRRDPGPVVDHAQLDVAAVHSGVDRDLAGPGASLDTVADGVLDERLHGHRRNDGAERLARNVDGDVKAAAETSLLESQVALDVLELLAEGDVRAPVAEQVARELGEVDQQLARLVRPRVDVPGDGGERVIDEVRRDLRAERSQLWLGFPVVR
jgi:hypothetical protein